MRQSRSSATFISWDSFPGISHQYLCDNQDQAQPLPLGIVFRAFRNVDDLVCTCQFASLLDEFVVLFTPFFFFIQTGVFAVHVFGAQNLYLDANFPPEHYGIYVQITAGSTTKCTSVQSPLKKGHVVWDEIRNFPVTVSQEFRQVWRV